MHFSVPLFSNIGAPPEHFWTTHWAEAKFYAWKTLGTPHVTKWFDLEDERSRPETYVRPGDSLPENDIVQVLVSTCYQFIYI